MSIEAMKPLLREAHDLLMICSMQLGGSDTCRPCIDKLRKAAAEAQSAEPVAWIVHGDGGLKTFTQTNPKHLVFPGGGSITPLYPHPAPPASGEREALIEALLDRYPHSKLLLQAVDMLDADALGLAALEAATTYEKGFEDGRAYARVPMTEQWMPIETAAKFSDEIDLWSDGCRVPECAFGKPTYGKELGWIYESRCDSEGPVYELVKNPTHWMKIPCAPKDGITEQCYCDKQGIGEPGVSCGDCPTRDYKGVTK